MQQHKSIPHCTMDTNRACRQPLLCSKNTKCSTPTLSAALKKTAAGGKGAPPALPGSFIIAGEVSGRRKAEESRNAQHAHHGLAAGGGRCWQDVTVIFGRALLALLLLLAVAPAGSGTSAAVGRSPKAPVLQAGSTSRTITSLFSDCLSQCHL